MKLYDALLTAGGELSYQLNEERHAWLQVIKGIITVNGIPLHAGDGAAISEETTLSLTATKDAEIILFDLA